MASIEDTSRMDNLQARLEELTGLDPTSEILTKLVSTFSDEQAETMLAVLEDADARRACKALKTDPNPVFRACAASSLSTFGVKYIPDLLEAMRADDPVVGEAVVAAICAIGPSAVPLCIADIERNGLTFGYLEIFKNLRDSSAAPVVLRTLENLIKNELKNDYLIDDDLINTVVDAIGRICEKDRPVSSVLPTLERVAEIERCSGAAMDALASAGGREAIRPLLRLLASLDTRDGRLHAILTLDRLYSTRTFTDSTPESAQLKRDLLSDSEEILNSLKALPSDIVKTRNIDRMELILSGSKLLKEIETMSESEAVEYLANIAQTHQRRTIRDAVGAFLEHRAKGDDNTKILDALTSEVWFHVCI